MSTLARLVGEPQEFTAGWPAEPTVYQRDAADLAELFTHGDARRIVTDPALRPIGMGMVTSGTALTSAPDADHPRDTLVLNGLHLSWPPLRDAARLLSAELGHPVTANVYRTPADATGYGPHWDTHHVFLAQVDGMKVWRLHPPVFTDPLERHPWTRVGLTQEQLDQIHRVARTVTLTAGQVLYIPRGWIHFGHTEDQQSIHITLGVQLLTRHWVLQQLADQAAEHPEMRAALPPNLSALHVEDIVGDTTSTLQAWLAGLDPAQAGGPIHISQQLAVYGVTR
ncbi:cupin domain-containing protein [Kitasatospora sp. NBC_01250]|uniref:JmjC domain-containing protein n=1 Tax=Kitasatospora sp. NBC_01250 TaxID=2903571 RepID=UPI002E30A35E|nr:cupin domain-containing protein [Kitasatospora sp. NBC_01250]